MSVKLRKRKNSDGSTSLYLDIYDPGAKPEDRRSYEFLKHLRLVKPANALDRQDNKEKLQQAEKIAVKRALELSASDYAMVSDVGRKTIVVEWMQDFVNGYTKKDKRNMQGALNRFSDFLREEKKVGLVFGQLTEVLISDFQDYLRHHSKGEGSASYFNRFKKMVKQAVRKNMLQKNPASEVRTILGKARKKDVLTLEEIQKLANTPTESEHVKRAFLFSCVTGMRWIDIKDLTWQQIDLSNKTISFAQSKTERDVMINLNTTALKLLGEPSKANQHVFDLPTANGANKTVKAWVKRAKIQKQITWHNARHSFGTNLIFFGTDVITASNLLGHSSLKHTQRYVRTANELKEKATDNLNFSV